MAIVFGRKKARKVMLDWESMRPKVGSTKTLSHLVQSLASLFPKQSSIRVQLYCVPQKMITDFTMDRFGCLVKYD